MVETEGFARLRAGPVGGKTCHRHVFLHASPSNPESDCTKNRGHPFGWPLFLTKDCYFNKMRLIVDSYQRKPKSHRRNASTNGDLYYCIITHFRITALKSRMFMPDHLPRRL